MKIGEYVRKTIAMRAEAEEIGCTPQLQRWHELPNEKIETDRAFYMQQIAGNSPSTMELMNKIQNLIISKKFVELAALVAKYESQG